MPTTRSVAVDRLTTTEAAVLALLAIEGERSAYDLTKLVAQAIAHVWSPARSGLYAVLPRLVKDGLAQRRVAAQSSRPDKQLYRGTRAGRRALDDWLETVRRAALPRCLRRGPTEPEVPPEQCRAVPGVDTEPGLRSPLIELQLCAGPNWPRLQATDRG
jgi:DNA-binding PadR family transcriptional regulator